MGLGKKLTVTDQCGQCVVSLAQKLHDRIDRIQIMVSQSVDPFQIGIAIDCLRSTVIENPLQQFTAEKSVDQLDG